MKSSIKIKSLEQLVNKEGVHFNENGIAKINYSSFNSENKLINKKKIKKWPTLTSVGAHANLKILDNKKIKILSGKEMLRIQGFKIKKNMNLVSNTTLKFLAGNSISIYALKEQFSNIKPKTIGVAFGGIDAVGEFFGRKKVINYIEIDKKVINAHNIIYKTNHVPLNFLNIDKMDGELLHFSPPCINFSNQGKGSKIDEFSKNIIKVIKNSDPIYISIENVLGYRKVLEEIKEELISKYNIQIKVIEPHNQSRKRIFLLGIKKNV